MKIRSILLYTTSLVCGIQMMAQEHNLVAVDTTAPKISYGIRFGGDLSKLLRTAVDADYSGFEVMGDLRFSKRFYAAMELGYEDRVWDQSQVRSAINGSYIKIGADFNAYNNWKGMDNAISTGLRYGLARFANTLETYPIYTTDPTYPTVLRTEPIEFTGLTAGWLEFILAIRTEVWSHFYLSVHVQLKHMINETKPENFDNLIVPGFNKTNDYSAFGVGYGYSLTYYLPLLKR